MIKIEKRNKQNFISLYFLVFSIFFFFNTSLLVAQTNINISNTTTTIICGQTYNFYDSGGPTGQYSFSENFTHTFTSSSGTRLILTFTSFNTESSWDKLSVYNGTSATGTPVINQHSGTTLPSSVTSSGASLTVKFTSDGSVVKDGWVATIRCACPTINIATTVVNESCFGNCNGSITSNASGGATPYTYNWTGPNSFTANQQNISNLCMGNYTLSVTDANSCPASKAINLIATTIITPTFNGLTTTYCNRASIPPLPTTSSNGITGTWSPAINNTTTTEYTFTPDAGQCARSYRTYLTILPRPAATITGRDVLCPGGSTTITASGGVSYVWNTTATTAQITVSTIGFYEVTVKDANNCTAAANVSVSRSSPLLPSITIERPLNCYGDSATVRVSASGGNLPYTGIGRFNLGPGTRTFHITDNFGCTADTAITIISPTKLTINKTTSNAQCFGGFGTANVSCSGATPDYTILWEDNTSDFINTHVPADRQFHFTVTDANSCTTIDSVLITQPTEIQAYLSSTDASCYNGNDGKITIDSIKGGVPAYTIVWSNGQNSNTITNLSQGEYLVTIRDNRNCSIIKTTTINQPSPMNITLRSQNPNCRTASLGSITASVSNGTAPYTYTWSNMTSESSIHNLTPSTYHITVTDNNHCSLSQSFDLIAEESISPEIHVLKPISCAGVKDGQLRAVTRIYNGNVSYLWNNSMNTDTILNLEANRYTVIATDTWGCTGTAEHTLTDPPIFDIDAKITDVTCYGSNNGKIDLILTGGTRPYNALWLDGNNNENRNNLAPGIYRVVVNDLSNCSATRSFEIKQPEPISLDVTHTNALCYGVKNGSVSITATGGIPPYNYNISNKLFTHAGNANNKMPAGIYNIKVTDNNKCLITSSVEITQPPALSYDYVTRPASCKGAKDGYIILNILGATPPYTLTYSSNLLNSLDSLRSLAPGTYNILIQDANNCKTNISNIIIDETPIHCISIPEAFTPNGDGINDTWKIKNIDLYPKASVLLFNRWGQQIWEGDATQEWDGKYKGNFVAQGTYLYIVTLHNELNETKKGTVTVIY